MTNSSESEKAAKVLEMAREIKTAMYVSLNESGALHGRPMEAVRVEDDGKFWFFTIEESRKTDETQDHRQINLSFIDSQSKNYVSISGRARMVDDQKLKRNSGIQY